MHALIRKIIDKMQKDPNAMSDMPGAKAGYIHAPRPLYTTPPKGRANHSGLVYGL